jgi:hypothetical protein
MSYRPDEKDFMDYLYGELEGQEKVRFEHYLLEHPEAQQELRGFQQLQSMLGTVRDKEVIAPPLVIGDTRRSIWHTPYLRTVLAIAASFTLVIVVGRVSGLQMRFSDGELVMSFGEPKVKTESAAAPSLTAQQVQQMIDASVTTNNNALQTDWKQSQAVLNESIRKNLAVNSVKINDLVKQAASASQDQIKEYVAGIQAENKQVVKDYFQLTASDQKKYIENLLVDFAKYLQQQRTEDLKLVQSRLSNIEQNTDQFKQETEQILSSIITNVAVAPSNAATPKKVSMY